MKNRWFKSCVAAALIVLALMTLLLDCVGLSNTAQGLMSGDGFSALLNRIPSLSAFIPVFSLNGEAGTGSQILGSLTRALSSGGLSPVEMRSLLCTAVGILRANPAPAAANGADPDLALSILSAIDTAGIALTVALALALVLGLFALAGALLNRRGWGIPLAVTMILALVGETVFVLVINSTVSADDLLGLSAGPFLGFALALAGLLVCVFWRTEGSARASRPNRHARDNRGKRRTDSSFSGEGRRGGWTCSICGTPVEADSRFCPGCGSPRPASGRCPRCGVHVEGNAAFCSACGAPLSKGSPGFGPAASRPCGSAPGHPAQPVPAQRAGGAAVPRNGTTNPGSAILGGTVRLMPREGQDTLALNIELHQDWQNVHRQSFFNLTESAMVGRLPDCDLQIADNTISGHHMKLERERDKLFVTDLKSANGTLLNGTALLRRAQVNSGDVLTLGNTRLIIRF